MQKKQSKNLRKSINEIWKMWRGKSTKKEHSDRENCQEDSQQRNYTGGQTSDMTRNTRGEWKRTRDDKRVRNL